MVQFDINKRFHLVARRRDNNQDDLLFEFNEDYQFHYYMGEVDKDTYKEISIIEKLGYDYPVCVASQEIKDYKPYTRKLVKHENNKSKS